MPMRAHRTVALLLSADPSIAESVATIAGAVGLALEVVDHLEASGWAGADVVLVGTDLLPAVANARPVRRSGVVVVGVCAQDQMWRPALEIGAEHVAFLPIAQGWLTERLADVAEGPGRSGAVIGVIAGSGGAGASTLAAGLAQAAAQRGGPPLLIDLDPLGGGSDLLLGAEREPGRRWGELSQVQGRLGVGVLAESLPSSHGVAVLTWDSGAASAPDAAAVHSVLDAGVRGHDHVVVDLPRSLDAAGLAAIAHLDRLLLVATDDLRSAVATSRLCNSLPQVRTSLVVRRRAGTLAAADVAAVTGLELLAEYRSEPELTSAAERGDPPLWRRGPLRELCRRLAAEVDGDTAA